MLHDGKLLILILLYIATGSAVPWYIITDQKMRNVPKFGFNSREFCLTVLATQLFKGQHMCDSPVILSLIATCQEVYNRCNTRTHTTNFNFVCISVFIWTSLYMRQICAAQNPVFDTTLSKKLANLDVPVSTRCPGNTRCFKGTHASSVEYAEFVVSLPSVVSPPSDGSIVGSFDGI